MGHARKLATSAAALTLAAAAPAFGWELAGDKEVVLHGRDGSSVRIARVHFEPAGDSVRFELQMDHARFKDFFLSMKEFKCLETSGEIQCHVPYPYANPATVRREDLRWLEHSLLFLFKSPKDFGAKLWNGIYYRLEDDGEGLVGTPYAVDLNLIGAPPADPDQPPYSVDENPEYPEGSRWFGRLTIR